MMPSTQEILDGLTDLQTAMLPPSWRDTIKDAQAEIYRLRAQRDDLFAALNLVMIGGNHLANVLIGRLGGGFATQYPPDLDHEIALRMLGATDTYAVWCCWAAIMTARAAVEEKP